MATFRQLDNRGRWWLVNDREIDLNADTYQGLHRVTALAHRDATDDEGRNIAALLETALDAGNTPADMITIGWLFTQSQRIVDRIRARLQHHTQTGGGATRVRAT